MLETQQVLNHCTCFLLYDTIMSTHVAIGGTHATVKINKKYSRVVFLQLKKKS